MKKQTLNFYPAGDKLVNDFAALEAGICRYVGRKFNPLTKCIETTGKPTEVQALPEYVIATKLGDLIPADKSTADYCGVEFNQNIIEALSASLGNGKVSFQP